MQAVTLAIRVIDAPQRENQGFADRPRGVDRPSATLKLPADTKKNYAIFNVLERSSFATRKLTIHINLQLVNKNESEIRREPFLSCRGDKIKETGFLPFSSAVTKYSRKNPVSDRP
ncbi:hypothetical protein Q5692_18145 [Microcoleus sp. C2C3]|uniref:hypothetical protein n=1 Tax=unclassified Microcoleus TaxID=2642155 RepID=UPI002FD5A069